MNAPFTGHFRNAADSSLIARRLRHLAWTSIGCAVAAASLQWLRRTRARIVMGVGGDWSPDRDAAALARLKTLAGHSRVVGSFDSLMAWSEAAWDRSKVHQALQAVFPVDLSTRMQVVGVMLVSAVIAHALLLAAIGEAVHALGWSVRASLSIVALTLVRWPDRWAAAWIDRRRSWRSSRLD